jgi:hypothetical protein
MQWGAGSGRLACAWVRARMGAGALNLPFSLLRHMQHSNSSSTNSTAQHSTAQHSTAQHSTAQHSTAQHSTAQHSTGSAGPSSPLCFLPSAILLSV